MGFIRIIKESFKVLKTNKRRTFLTSLGIIIGVASVIMIMSVGAGAQSLIFNQITSSGASLIAVMPGYSDEDGPPASVFGINVTTLTQDDAEALKKIERVEAVTSYVRGVDTAQYLNKTTDTTFVGTTSEYLKIEDAKTQIGTFFSQEDDKGVGKVAVLGWQTYKDLFGDENPIGKRIKIKRESFRVIGVMKKRGVVQFQNQDNLIFVPIKTAQKILLGINHVNIVRAKARDNENVKMVASEIESVIRERHGLEGSEPNDFSVRDAASGLEALSSVTDALKLFLSAIAAVSLIVGGIGIMNIMLISIRERTREIGLRKAIGATKDGIQTQFLIEALVLTLLGGIIGIIIGASVSALIAFVAKYLGYDWDYVVSLGSIIMGVGVSSAVGIIFGWYPAKQASDLEAVAALHYE